MRQVSPTNSIFEDGRCGARTHEHPEFIRNLSGTSEMAEQHACAGASSHFGVQVRCHQQRLEQIMADNSDTKSTQERGRAAITAAAQRTASAVEESTGSVAEAGHLAKDITERSATAGAETIRHLG